VEVILTPYTLIACIVPMAVVQRTDYRLLKLPNNN
jgi:hypothetical protein